VFEGKAEEEECGASEQEQVETVESRLGHGVMVSVGDARQA
jgi:hypothetical protein